MLLSFDPLTQELMGARPETAARLHLKNRGFLEVSTKYPGQVLASSPIHNIKTLGDRDRLTLLTHPGFLLSPAILEILKTLPCW